MDVSVVHKDYFKRNFALDWAPPISKSRIIKDTNKVGKNLINFMKNQVMKPMRVRKKSFKVS